MLDARLRSLKDRALDPLARATGAFVHPDLVTAASFAVGLGVAVLAWRQLYAWALALWLLNRVLDGFDGSLARVHGMQSDFGGYLDLVLDFVVYAAIPLAIVLGQPADAAPWLALAALLASFYVNAASWTVLAALLEKRARGAAARGEQTSVTMPQALVEGTETILFFTLFLLLPHAAATLFSVMALLVAVSAIQRVTWAARHL